MSSTLFALTIAMLAPQDGSADWPNFGGPDGLGTSPLTDVSFDWPAEGPEVAWRLEVGKGFGGVAVRDGEVVILDREVGETDVLRVLDLGSGEEVWSDSYAAEGRLNYAGSRAVPTVTEKYIYTVGGHGRVVCYSRDAREEVWSLNLEEDYGGQIPGYGWSGSPLVVGDTVIVTALGEEVGLVGLNRFTGEELWITTPVGVSHSTPSLLNLLGEPQVVFVSSVPGDGNGADEATFLISSYDPTDGTVIWETKIPLCRYPIPGATQIDNDRFFVTGGYQGGSSMMRVKKGEGGYELEQLFHIERGAQMYSPILVDEHLYFVVNENWNDPRNKRAEGGLMCLSLDGEEMWRTKDDPYFGRGNWILVNGHLILQDGHDGTLRVARATPTGYEQVAEANLFGIDDRRDHQMWAPMAVAGRFLLLRSQDELLCVRL